MLLLNSLHSTKYFKLFALLHTSENPYLDIYSLPYFETSAASGQNVNKAVECLLDRVMLRMEQSIDKTQLPAKNGRQITGEVELDEASGSSKCACWYNGAVTPNSVKCFACTNIGTNRSEICYNWYNIIQIYIYMYTVIANICWCY